MKFSSEFKHFHSRKCIWKCRLRNGVHLSRPQWLNPSGAEVGIFGSCVICYWDQCVLVFREERFNSLWPSGAICRHRTGSTLVQVIACCMTGHYLNTMLTYRARLIYHQLISYNYEYSLFVQIVVPIDWSFRLCYLNGYLRYVPHTHRHTHTNTHIYISILLSDLNWEYRIEIVAMELLCRTLIAN